MSRFRPGCPAVHAVINSPRAAVLAVGEAVRQPAVHRDQVTVGTIMAVTLSIGHRGVEGAAVGFPARLRELIAELPDIVV